MSWSKIPNPDKDDKRIRCNVEVYRKGELGFTYVPCDRPARLYKLLIKSLQFFPHTSQVVGEQAMCITHAKITARKTGVAPQLIDRRKSRPHITESATLTATE